MTIGRLTILHWLVFVSVGAACGAQRTASPPPATADSLPEPSPSVCDAEAADTPCGVAATWLMAFHDKDFETVRSFFAPGAVYTSMKLGADGPEARHWEAGAWLDGVIPTIEQIEGFRAEILGMTAIENEHGTAVSVSFRGSGTIHGHDFTNDGIDTMVLVDVGGSWRILQYSSFEKST